MATTTATTVTPIKAQLVDKLPKRFKGIKFGIQSNQDIANQAVLEVSDRLLYDIENNRAPYQHGPLDPRLGTSSKTGKCATCHEALQNCTGHFGHVRLPLPAFHIGYLRFVMMILQDICKDCGKVLLTETERRAFLKELRRPLLDNLRRSQICKRINEQCRKVKNCMYCGSVQGQIRKVGVLKLAHDKFVHYNKSTSAKKVPPESKIRFDESFAEARKNNGELDKHLRKAMEDMNPLRVLNLFKLISPTDCELLGLNPAEGRPEMFVWQFLPAPPVCIRPSVAQDNASNEDDITTKLADIVWVSGMIRSALQKGSPVQTIMEQWEYLQLQVAMYVNSDVPGLQQPGFGKAVRGFCQRLKGKQGRFRGNLSGKRVDFSGRTVISPDPNLGIDQVAVPQLVAKNLTYPERVSDYNIKKLKECVRNGPSIWPGAQQVIKNDDGGYKISLKFGNRNQVAQDLQVGDVVERHLEDDDIVLFNRQPSLHKLSIMSHLVKVRPWRTFRLNECVCGPYNADFDGDEMNLHVPQTEEARAEAINLMGVKHNLATPKNGEPVIAATQDFITAAYLLSGKDRFFDRKTFTYICMHMMDGNVHLDLPPPAIVKPQALWTGKQVFSMMMRPNKDSPVKINLDAKCREYKARAGQCPDMDPNDGWLVIRNSEVMCGRMDKSTVGSGKKDSVFYVILRDFGPDAAVVTMNRLAKLCARHLTNRGFSIGVGDVFPTALLLEKKSKMIRDANKDVDELIDKYKKDPQQEQRTFGHGKIRIEGLMKSLEDLSTQYDDTVRTSGGGIVQFQFGADKLDPVDMEASAKPVNFDRTWSHAENLTWNNEEAALLPDEIIYYCDDILDYDNQEDKHTDEHEGARDFLRSLESYVGARANKLRRVMKLTGLTATADSMELDMDEIEIKAKRAFADKVAKVSETTLQLFIRLCLGKYKKAHVEPGHAVGAVGAQSIGEPGTQMTLKTFHFAGVAGMSITQGVPRIKEIINASKLISTPVITCPLMQDREMTAARIVKARIEKTFVEDILSYIEDEWFAESGNVVLQVDMDALSNMQLGIGLGDVAEAICKHKKLKVSRQDMHIGPGRIEIRVRLDESASSKRSTKTKPTDEHGDLLVRANYLRRIIPTVAISGYPEATRAIIQSSEHETHTVLVEGYGLLACMNTEGVDGRRVKSNNIMECRDVLGIEAARTTIAHEIGEVMGDMGIDPRHMQLLADVMTYKGEVLGITRFGLSKMRDSVLQLASFEKTPDHLFEAAAGMKTDQIEGVSECIIMGQTMSVVDDGYCYIATICKGHLKMCGRYALNLRPSQIRRILEQDNMDAEDAPDDDCEGAPRQTYNFAPGNRGVVYRADVTDRGAGDGINNTAFCTVTGTSREQARKYEDPARIKYRIQAMEWGLIPFWTKRDPGYSTLSKTINCRDDSLARPGGMWCSMKAGKRCIVIAQGFYEWLKKGKDKVPYFVKRRDGRLMCFAGLWDCVELEGAAEKRYTYTIITTDSNEQLKFLHDRMPVIFEPGSEDLWKWLDPRRHEWSQELQHILRPTSEELDCYPVTQDVNKVGNNSPTFVIPVASKENKHNIANFFQNSNRWGEAPTGASGSAGTGRQYRDIEGRIQQERQACG
ncbi:DNA-directed RNA polymerase III subunit rpc1 [Colletotrichum orbiculare MAFF 240422]|uniref:DNA-directed RNA polymerase subunit n=1 Tax=Colletotrichum orbiculare (strain 104-T / ATCC 96160 / CBS 514.97 / LARS 414 / MAFF 240422) TaxID=1213857 RepID=A0A484G460_COLOR|nr:DNA-directed RNA polymerase III subunit rpc1 [Colletotrichum orbiculare MAFF 240422]